MLNMKFTVHKKEIDLLNNSEFNKKDKYILVDNTA